MTGILPKMFFPRTGIKNTAPTADRKHFLLKNVLLITVQYVFPKKSFARNFCVTTKTPLTDKLGLCCRIWTQRATKKDKAYTRLGGGWGRSGASYTVVCYPSSAISPACSKCRGNTRNGENTVSGMWGPAQCCCTSSPISLKNIFEGLYHDQHKNYPADVPAQ